MRWDQALERVETRLKVEGKSPHTVDMYLLYLRKFSEFVSKNPRKVEFYDVEKYFASLTNVSNSTKTLTKAAIKYLYNKILDKPIVDTSDKTRLIMKKDKKIPVVLNKKEIQDIFSVCSLRDKMIFKFIYSGGLRLSEAVNARVKDIDFDRCMEVDSVAIYEYTHTNNEKRLATFYLES